jgi:hypothetical protein
VGHPKGTQKHPNWRYITSKALNEA